MAPHGRVYISSWVDDKQDRCFQLDDWMANWRDLVDFEVYPVMTSAQATEKVTVAN